MPSTLRQASGTTRRRVLSIAILDDGRQQRDIAAAAGISEPTLSGIVTGRIRDPKPETRARIADALGADEAPLFPEFHTVETETIGYDPERTAKVQAERIAQGLPAELTDEQMAFIDAVVHSPTSHK